MYQITEFRRLINFSVRKEILPPSLSLLHGEEDCLYHIGNIDESDILTLETNREIDMVLDTMYLHEIVTLTRTIDTSRTEDDVGEGRGES